MTEILVIASFILILTCCLVMDYSIVLALAIGYFLFAGFAFWKGFKLSQIALMTKKGILKVKNILVTFVLIGILTAFWRSGGVVASIICYSFELVNPSIFLCMAFLLNCAVSFLTGTALGTAATMGVICMTMCQSLGISSQIAGGAILAGVYFGDRCSPVSTSAMLVGEVTGTDLYDNIINMMKTGLIPFLAATLFYLFLGRNTKEAGSGLDVYSLFSREFKVHILCLVPALMIILLACLRVKVRATLFLSVLAAAFVSLFIQKLTPTDLLHIAVYGFEAKDTLVGEMLNGGGILSMGKVACIVTISSSYSDIFDQTELLKGVKRKLLFISEHFSVFGTTLIAAILNSMITCNQSMAIILTESLCGELEEDKKRFASFLENSAVVIAPLVPWTVASTTPLRAIDAPSTSILYASYLYFLPLWQLILAYWQNRRGKNSKSDV